MHCHGVIDFSGYIVASVYTFSLNLYLQCPSKDFTGRKAVGSVAFLLRFEKNPFNFCLAVLKPAVKRRNEKNPTPFCCQSSSYCITAYTFKEFCKTLFKDRSQVIHKKVASNDCLSLGNGKMETQL